MASLESLPSIGLSGDMFGFTPFTLDTSPLQNFLQSIAKIVDALKQDNIALRAELVELKVGGRLDALERGLQALAGSMAQPGSGSGSECESSAHDSFVRPDSGAGGSPHEGAGQGGAKSSWDIPPHPATSHASSHGNLSHSALAGATASAAHVQATAAGPAGPAHAGAGKHAGEPSLNLGATLAPGHGSGSDLNSHGQGGHGGPSESAWVIGELAVVKDRLGAMERKAETLWHKRESEELLHAAIARLQRELDAVQALSTESVGAARGAVATMERLDGLSSASAGKMTALQEQLSVLEAHNLKVADERKGMAVKMESSTDQIWDQIRHVESSLNQRLGLAEAAQASTLQEVDDTKETANEVLGRVDETKRHMAALEGKLESFNSAVTAAIAPLHSSLERQADRIDQLHASKQDAATAVTAQDVNSAMAQAVAHADARVGNLLRAVASIEQRLEELNEGKAGKDEVVMSFDMRAILSTHAAELDTHLDSLKADILAVLQLKADRDELQLSDARLMGRVAGLEGAILKGLRAVSDKVSAALAEKLDLLRFDEFKIQVRAILADVEDRLRDWSPTALAFKSGMDASGTGAAACLMCDSRVRSARDLRSLGFTNEDKVFAPERLPATDPLLPNISAARSLPLGAYHNARHARNKAATSANLARSTQSIVLEGLPGPAASNPAAHAPSQTVLATVDPTSAMLQGLPSSQSPHTIMGNKGSRVKVDLETISAQLANGKIPNTRGRGPPQGEPRNLVSKYVDPTDPRIADVRSSVYAPEQSSFLDSKFYNYQSPLLHHAVVANLTASTTYYYYVGDGSGNSSMLMSFRTPPAAGAHFPMRLAIAADVGQTYNASVTFDHMRQSLPDVVLLIGDISYADHYSANGVGVPGFSAMSTYQPAWDTQGRLMQPLLSQFPHLQVPGNHEAEYANYTRVLPSSPMFDAFNSWYNRYGVAQPTAGNRGIKHPWYSTNVGPAHIIGLSAYMSSVPGSDQYAWLENDLQNVDRALTPWVVIQMHAPLYNTLLYHYKAAECQRQSLEPLFFQHGVDIYMAGHVHSYERSNKVNNYTVDACGTTHLTMGDGGNIEGLRAVYVTSSNQTSPPYSAFREPSFGHATLDFLNVTHALWQWHRNQDGAPVVADHKYLVKAQCANQGSLLSAYLNGTSSAFAI
ncbi:MAG: hypothetical protein WDW38_002281 [Sanguina aurantia]